MESLKIQLEMEKLMKEKLLASSGENKNMMKKTEKENNISYNTKLNDEKDEEEEKRKKLKKSKDDEDDKERETDKEKKRSRHGDKKDDNDNEKEKKKLKEEKSERSDRSHRRDESRDRSDRRDSRDKYSRRDNRDLRDLRDSRDLRRDSRDKSRRDSRDSRDERDSRDSRDERDRRNERDRRERERENAEREKGRERIKVEQVAKKLDEGDRIVDIKAKEKDVASKTDEKGRRIINSPPRHRQRSPSRERRMERNATDRSNGRTERSDKRDKKEDKSSSGPKQATLKDIFAAYPGISIAEAAIKLNSHNSAIAMGLPAPDGGLVELVMTPGYGEAPVNMTYIGGIGEGGPDTINHRELFIGNTPPGTTVTQLAEFLNALMKQLGITTSQASCVVSAWVSNGGTYSFVEFRSAEETQSALQYLNGLQVGKYTLKVGRPKGYVGGEVVTVPTGIATNLLNKLTTSGNFPSLGGHVASAATAVSHALLISNMPSNFNLTQVRELVSAFGEVKSLNLIRTGIEGDDAQTVVLEYSSPSATDDAVVGLNNLDVGWNKLDVQRLPAEAAAILLQPKHQSSDDMLESYAPSRVLRLNNMVMDEDLADDEAYEDLKKDILDECSKFGDIISIEIPRPVKYGGYSSETDAVGQIFLNFKSLKGSEKAKAGLVGRTFNDKPVIAVFYPEDLFAKRVFVLPSTFITKKVNLSMLR